jgi:CheY-like chemotaxis protein
MHGGSVSVTSVEGQGATFTVRLPAERTHATAVPASRHRPSGLLVGLNVLVVDDDEDAREIAERMLEDQGAVVMTAESAGEAYDLLTRVRPDVLVCDIGMPNEDGLAFIRRLRQDSDPRVASIPALAVTAFAGEQDRQRALLAGFHGHLAKPIAAHDLVRCVRELARVEDAETDVAGSSRA